MGSTISDSEMSYKDSSVSEASSHISCNGGQPFSMLEPLIVFHDKLGTGQNLHIYFVLYTPMLTGGIA